MENEPEITEDMMEAASDRYCEHEDRYHYEGLKAALIIAILIWEKNHGR